MSSPDIKVDTNEVRQHARRIDAHADGVMEAHSAAKQVSMDDNAYGVICSFLPKYWINDLENSASQGIGAGTELLTGSAQALRVLADNLDEADRAAAEKIKGKRHG